MTSRQPLVACPALVVTVISASMTRTGMPPKRDSQDPSPQRLRTGSFGEQFPLRTRIRKRPWFPRSARPGTRRRSSGRRAGSCPRAGWRAGPGRRWSRLWIQG